MERATRITKVDFFVGIFAAIALKGHKGLSRNKFFEEHMVRIFQELKRRANQDGIDMDFHIRHYPIYGYSKAIHKGVLVAMQTGIISLDGPRNDIIRIKLTEDEAMVILDNITGGQMFIDFADRIIQIFSQDLLKTER